MKKFLQSFPSLPLNHSRRVVVSYKRNYVHEVLVNCLFKETKSATMNIFRIFLFLFKSFVKVELSYVFTINLFTIAENCTEK